MRHEILLACLHCIAVGRLEERRYLLSSSAKQQRLRSIEKSALCTCLDARRRAGPTYQEREQGAQRSLETTSARRPSGCFAESGERKTFFEIGTRFQLDVRPANMPLRCASSANRTTHGPRGYNLTHRTAVPGVLGRAALVEPAGILYLVVGVCPCAVWVEALDLAEEQTYLEDHSPQSSHRATRYNHCIAKLILPGHCNTEQGDTYDAGGGSGAAAVVLVWVWIKAYLSDNIPMITDGRRMRGKLQLSRLLLQPGSTIVRRSCFYPGVVVEVSKVALCIGRT
ncbi:hypothetical protein DOTSEDRAFT_70699 [Dothistroma septosporum NZE10]|uniref:Uncharacterized protein n=1 Tax=Dothistroma septosporum (strain NZE10 / CBS 128990) TaxID=675120 RepID=N1PX65_DOTSN|nr:hypothetical protein DOTSEDRAFT_70699 [Dothistroma septosporum NZE10]